MPEIPEGLREELARTLDPGAFEAPNNEHAMRRALRVARQKIAFDLADRILAAYHVLPRSGGRACLDAFNVLRAALSTPDTGDPEPPS